jgi:hypothetical protein
VNTLSAECKKLASDKRRACQSYTQRLKQRMAELGLTPETTDRLKTASATQMLVDKLAVGELNAIVKQLASANVETSETAMGECVGKAAELEGNLDTAGWQTFELIRKLPDAHQPTAQKILTDLRSALASDEHVMELAPALRSAQAQAMRLLEKLVEVKPLTTPPPISPPPTKQEKQIVEQDSRQDLTLLAAKELLAEIDSKKKSGQSVRVNVSWVIEEGGEA